VLGQQIIDIIPSVNSEFALVAMPNGILQLHSSVLNMSEIKQTIMFSNDGEKILKNHTY